MEQVISLHTNPHLEDDGNIATRKRHLQLPHIHTLYRRTNEIMTSLLENSKLFSFMNKQSRQQ